MPARYKTGLILITLLPTLALAQLYDPTKPPEVSNTTKENMIAVKNIVVNMIIYSPGKSTAMINGKTLQVGDLVENYKIARITPRFVYLESKNAKGVVKLKLSINANVHTK